MARLNVLPSAESDGEGDLYGDSLPASTRRSSAHPRTPATFSPSPTASSDKENQGGPVLAARRQRDKSQGSMGPPRLPTPNSASNATPRGPKRRRLGEHNVPLASQVPQAGDHENFIDLEYYDPYQDIEQRRALRKGIRDLHRELHDSSTEYLAAESTGLQDTLRKADAYFNQVKSTSDATIDSRLLVSTGDLAHKKTTQSVLGDSSLGVDIDEFVSKCITFMNRGPAGEDDEDGPAPTNHRRRARGGGEEDDDLEDDEGDALNWEWLGQRACFPHNARPPVAGFLLGPLSVPKRLRTPKPRQAGNRRKAPAEVVRPEEIRLEDIDRNENNNLTVLCSTIKSILETTIAEGKKHVQDEATDDMSQAEIQALMKRHHISDDEGVPLFDFVINPRSFGQTVENLFYISFLIRNGEAGIGSDSFGSPTLQATVARSLEQKRAEKTKQHQAIFSLDYSTWRDLIDVFDIKEPLIPDRDDEEATQVGARGWYG